MSDLQIQMIRQNPEDLDGHIVTQNLMSHLPHLETHQFLWYGYFTLHSFLSNP